MRGSQLRDLPTWAKQHTESQERVDTRERGLQTVIPRRHKREGLLVVPVAL